MPDQTNTQELAEKARMDGAIEKLKAEIVASDALKEPGEAADWNTQEGILLSRNDGIAIIKALTAAPSEERERCAKIARNWLEQNIEDIRRGEELNWPKLLESRLRKDSQT